MRLLITGISGFIGQAIVARLMRNNPFEQVHGIDLVAPRTMGPVRFLLADLTRVELGDLIATHGIDCVLHLAYASRAGLAAAREERRVAGALMRAAHDTDLRRMVLASRDIVYAPSDRAVGEDAPLRAKDGQPPAVAAKIAIEALAASFDGSTRIVTARCANVVGPSAGGNLQNILSMWRIPAPSGRDPLVQLLSVDDAAGAYLALCAADEVESTYNVAGLDPLPLSVIAGILQRRQLTLPSSLLRPLAGLLARTRTLPFGAAEMRELFGGVPISTRRLTRSIYTPKMSTRQALAVWRVGNLESSA